METLYVIARKQRTDKRRGHTKIKNFQLQKIKKRAGYALITIMLVAFSAALIARPERYVAVCLEGIVLWAQCVLPALFPFMVVCALLVNTGLAEKLSSPLAKACGVFKLPRTAALCFAMSISSGYPAGSRTVSQFYTSGACTSDDCKKLACLCSTSGPLFVIGTVGAGLFGDGGTGTRIFAAHIIAVAAVAILLSLTGKKCRSSALPPADKRENILYESFYGSVSAALTAGAFIAFFYTAAAMAHDFYILRPAEELLGLIFDENLAAATAAGLIEMTGGCAALASSGSPLAVPLAGFIVTFGGACVILQQLSYLTKCRINSAKFIAVKFIQGVLCFLLLLIPL